MIPVGAVPLGCKSHRPVLQLVYKDGNECMKSGLAELMHKGESASYTKLDIEKSSLSFIHSISFV